MMSWFIVLVGLSLALWVSVGVYAVLAARAVARDVDGVGAAGEEDMIEIGREA